MSAELSQAANPAAATSVYLPLVIRSAGITLSSQEQRALDLINQARAQQGPGCPALVVSETLVQLARNHSRDMAINNFFSHINPSNGNVNARAQLIGYPGTYLGENLAVGFATADALVNDKIGWMNSPGHRLNILNCSFTETGIGLYDQPDDLANVKMDNNTVSGPFRYYWTHVFANPDL